MQLQDALGQFQVQLAADGRSVHTRKQYERHVVAMITWLASRGQPTDVAHLTPAIVAEFFTSDSARNSARGGAKKPTSANAQRTSLRNFCRWLHESGLAGTNAARLLRRARCSPPPPRALHADEQQRLLTVLDAATGPEAGRDRVLIRLLLGAGLRLGSALGLDVDDVDLAHGELTLRTAKNDRPAVTVLPKDIVSTMHAFLVGRTSGPLFMASGHRISVRHAQRRISGWFAAASIRGRSAHALRHSFAAGLLARTGDLRLVQAALNHASIVSTTIYTAVDRTRLRAAVGG